MVRRRGLNTPYGAWCFLTICTITQSTALWTGLNAPYGARSFLTHRPLARQYPHQGEVLMHLIALGAF